MESLKRDSRSAGAPKRIQRRRIKGWRMPDGAVYVGRGSEWGNPYTVKKYGRADAIAKYRQHLVNVYGPMPWVCEELRGKDLVCWCSLDQPCHADILLEFSNAPLAGQREA